MLRRALGFDKNCVRASVLQGRLEMREEDWNAAIDAFRRIWKQDPDFFDEVLSELRQCYQALEKEVYLIFPQLRLKLLHAVTPHLYKVQTLVGK